MNENKPPLPGEWAKLAEEALGLWQEALTNYSAVICPKNTTYNMANNPLGLAQFDMARSLFAEWMRLGQTQPFNNMQRPADGEKSQQAGGDLGHGDVSYSRSGDPAPAFEGGRTAEALRNDAECDGLASRVALLEQKMAAFEELYRTGFVGPAAGKK